VLIIPTINGDGRAAGTRGNSTGQDLNRDYSLIRQPETAAYVRMLRDYRPVAGYDGHEFANSQAGDLPMLPPRHQNVAQPIFDESLDMIENHMYVEGAKAGWWPCPYGCQNGGPVGLSEETILRNTLGLKNTVNSLLELRSAGGPTRPDEANAANNRRRKTFSALWTFNSFLDFHRAQLLSIQKARIEAIQFQSGNTGRIVFRGSRIIPGAPRRRTRVRRRRPTTSRARARSWTTHRAPTSSPTSSTTAGVRTAPAASAPPSPSGSPITAGRSSRSPTASSCRWPSPSVA
jgi:hypothetical protein